MTEEHIIELAKAQFPKLREQLSRSPTIRELARAVGVRASELRRALLSVRSDPLREDSFELDSVMQSILRVGEPRPMDQPIVLLDQNDNDLGTISFRNAMKMATERGLVLNLVDLNLEFPVVRLVDYEKSKYLLQKKFRAIGENKGVIKEIRIREAIQERDLLTKVKYARKQLLKGGAVRLVVELANRDDASLARLVSDRFIDHFGSTAEVVQEPDGTNGALIFTIHGSR